MKKQKYYVVWQGVKPGVYDTWAKCQSQIKGFPEAKYKSFESKEEAEKAFSSNYTLHIGQKTPKQKTAVKNSSKADIIWDSLSVDAACSGNPGIMEYQGVDTRSKERIFHLKSQLGTNNIGEFLAIVHALALMTKNNINKPIYTDSVTAMGWVKKKKANTKLERNAKTEELYQLIERAENWLKNNNFDIPILKWDTEHWGEIPADFGRK